MSELTFIMENYLEAIYELSKEKNFARISDIAERLSVTKASASSAVQTLMNKGYVSTEKYREVYLTEEGFKIAQFTATKHETLHKFLTEVLGVEDTIADTDACAIEHVISYASVKAMRSYMEKLNGDK